MYCFGRIAPAVALFLFAGCTHTSAPARTTSESNEARLITVEVGGTGIDLKGRQTLLPPDTISHVIQEAQWVSPIAKVSVFHLDGPVTHSTWVHLQKNDYHTFILRNGDWISFSQPY